MHPTVNELFDLTGKVALLTGGAGWLGTAFAEALAQAGAQVVLVDRDAAALQRAVAALKAQNLPVAAGEADATQEAPLRAAIDQAAADYGRLDILVNGMAAGPTPTLDEATYEDYDQGFHNGPSAYGIAAQQAVKHMRRVGAGSIINLGSMYAVVTGYPRVYEGVTKPNSIVYQAGKAAIVHMTRYMAVYWASDNIRVNCLSPGAFPNPAAQAIPQFKQRLEEKIPLARIGSPAELKGAVVFLASAASSYMTGHNLVVDGGWTLW